MAADASHIIITTTKWLVGHGNHNSGKRLPTYECTHNSVENWQIPGNSMLHLKELQPLYNHSALASEIHQWNAAFLSLLLDAGANASLTDKAEESALHVAVRMPS